MDTENLLSKAIVAKELALSLTAVAFEIDSLNIKEIDCKSIAHMINERIKKSSLILNIEVSVYAECAERNEYEFSVRLKNDPIHLAAICLTL